MACATLKRSLEWDSLNQRPSKRRRCNPFGSTDKTSKTLPINNSNILNGNDALISQNKTDTCDIKKKSSVFKYHNAGQISSDEMAEKIRDEIKRLYKRKELLFSSLNERMQDSESSGSEMGPESPRRPDSPATLMRHPEKGLFTFKQVQMICERMLKEKEDEMREKYDAILTTKLAEQYDAFVKFTYDQIQRRYEAAPSYLS